jgi:hypothetical protein
MTVEELRNYLAEMAPHLEVVVTQAGRLAPVVCRVLRVLEDSDCVIIEIE